jgi:hypothetical protein
MYLLAGTQHGEGQLPPTASNGQLLNNPTPQAAPLRALLLALRRWVTDGTPPPASRYPMLADGTLVRADAVAFPKIPGVPDPRTIDGPRQDEGRTVLPFLVPQVDEDGNERAGIRVPDQAVPLATTTGWNFRAERVGNPSNIYWLLGSYVPFARTSDERQQTGDPRRSVAERYPTRDAYLEKIRTAASDLVKGGYLLERDLPAILQRAAQHWSLRADAP